jgi:hypothetical protein
MGLYAYNIVFTTDVREKFVKKSVLF